MIIFSGLPAYPIIGYAQHVDIFPKLVLNEKAKIMYYIFFCSKGKKAAKIDRIFIVK